MTWTVTTRALGRRKPLLDDFSIPPPEFVRDGDDLRLRDLIEHVVRHEVCQFDRRQRTRQFDRCLTERQIDVGKEKGKIDPAARDAMQKADLEAAVGAALQGFEDGLFLVIIDEVEYRSLDDVVRLMPDSRIAFIRLAFLAGA